MPDVTAAKTLRVGLVQLQPTRDVATNLPLVLQAIADAGQQGAELIVIPENALCIGTNQMMRDAAVSLDGPEISAICAAAVHAGAHVVLGASSKSLTGRFCKTPCW
ncbi:nitrilase-related carbon-nitrogen hydrolase [Neopusillimonas aromaticivorans]|uniref:nitrilase-related carbon-nitrogen hydrolase n=1 Tax=Neopusillimonas aromaticivorans TaxID=2979868 RepID=UPI0033163AEE